MKKIIPILILLFPVLLFSQELVDFPKYDASSSANQYIGCDKILNNTPDNVNFSIYGDTLISLNKYDERLDISFKFNWDDQSGLDNFSIAVHSIEVINEGVVLDTIQLKNIVFLEAFPDYSKDGKIVRDDIYLTDINMDSFLDFQITRTCGKSCYKSYWVFNPMNNTFNYIEDLNFFRPYCFDCEKMMIYSYTGGTANIMEHSVYKIHNHKVEFYQSRYTAYYSDYLINQYINSEGNLILSDTVKYY